MDAHYDLLQEADAVEAGDEHSDESVELKIAALDHRRCRCRKLEGLWMATSVALAMIGISSTILAIWLSVRAFRSSDRICPSSDVLSPDHFPSIHAGRMSSYGLHYQYMSLDHKYDELWEIELAGNNGAIDLPELGEGEVGVISMFHQLHCLSAFRKVLQRAREGEAIGIDPEADGHWPHCFDYMRSAILCAAEGTIERPFNRLGQRVGAISGATDLRTCGDTRGLYARREIYGRMINPPPYKETERYDPNRTYGSS